jgi:hypothetical protein
MIDANGPALRDERHKIRYQPTCEWSSREIHNTFSQRVADLVPAAHSDAFDPTIRGPG